MMLSRRSAAIGLALAPMVPTGTAMAARSDAPNVIVYCDPALRHALTATGRAFTERTGARVNVFCAEPWMMLAQIAHVTQNDILVSGTATLAEAADRNLVRSEILVPMGRNQLVVATKIGAASTPRHSAAEIRALIGPGPLALPDPTSLTTVNAAEALRRLGLTPPYPFKTAGAANEADVAFLVASGAASTGLLYRTAAWADPNLTEAAVLPGSPTQAYTAAISTISRSPNAVRFASFLGTGEARARLAAAGLEGLS